MGEILMKVNIKNLEEILSNASTDIDREARRIALNAIERALESIDPKELFRSRVKLLNDKLIIYNDIFDLKLFRRIFVVGGGKASGYMAEVLEEIFNGRIENGIVVVPYGTAERFKTEIIRFHESSHPIPDQSSVEGARKILDLAKEANENDLVLCLFSGGGSSLMAYPREGISLEDKRRTTDVLLKRGATINEINTVRKHLSKFKGGQLARSAHPATIISLLISDVVGDPLDVIASGPTAPDTTTFKDAVNVLKKYNVWDIVPESVRTILSDGEKGLIEDTPKSGDPSFKKVYNYVIGNNRIACIAAVNELRRAGLNAILLTSQIEGEARNVGLIIGAVAKEMVSSNNPIQRPAGLVIGGETTVTVVGKGIGGRNQEICLASALRISGLKGVAIASVSTDGIDGPTDAAGAIVDGKTILNSELKGLAAEKYLNNNDSYSFFKRMGDLVYTGPTGTNVNDISILVVL